jgi:hypothetical protein
VEHVRSAVKATTNPAARFPLVKALCEYDVNENLVFVIDAMASYPTARPALVEFLKGRLDTESRLLLQGLVKSSEGDRRIMSSMVLQLVADDPESLRIAKSLVQETSEQTAEVATFLLLLGDAAYYNEDASALEVLRPFLWHEDRDIRCAAMIALRAVPGEEAAGVLRSIADDENGEFAGLATEILAQRLKDHAHRKPAPGWRNVSAPLDDSE